MHRNYILKTLFEKRLGSKKPLFQGRDTKRQYERCKTFEKTKLGNNTLEKKLNKQRLTNFKVNRELIYNQIKKRSPSISSDMYVVGLDCPSVDTLEKMIYQSFFLLCPNFSPNDVCNHLL